MARKQAGKTQKARVLVAVTVDGVRYEPDHVIEADQEVIESLYGQVDPHPDAVAYIEGNK